MTFTPKKEEKMSAQKNEDLNANATNHRKGERPKKREREGKKVNNLLFVPSIRKICFREKNLRKERKSERKKNIEREREREIEQ